MTAREVLRWISLIRCEGVSRRPGDMQFAFLWFSDSVRRSGCNDGPVLHVQTANFFSESHPSSVSTDRTRPSSLKET
ncbi:dimethylmenaquinone methyltransferase [Anopheles sinensis]|uniref:Dimethylmenaquinone methyltransferase n=1 Tax=Anopheles sinensis TaxID=74873 RepID=A0A084WGR0_ANOSI|nr:dimethylmenaquinone methyltransferase [Anopheles sinensis]